MNKRNILSVLIITFVCVAGVFCLQFNIMGGMNFLASLIGAGQKPAVYHIFFHSLILYPELAFSKSDNPAEIFKKYMITKTEFENVLQQLYNNNFVLVDVDSIYGINSDGAVFKKTPVVPDGKKPLIISLDDLSYYEYMKGRGFADKLVLDQNGNVATQVIIPDGKTIVTRDGDVVPILDDFIKLHPDFSINGAKGVIALTGYEGILGYDINNFYQKVSAERVVKKLKETGWKFASHSYSHEISFQTGEISLEELKSDTQKWKSQIEPLVGNTSIYIGPFGQIFKESDNLRNYLISQGFKAFFGVGMDTYLHYYPDDIVMDRADIDQYRLSVTPALLKPYFDPQLVVDK